MFFSKFAKRRHQIRCKIWRDLAAQTGGEFLEIEPDWKNKLLRDKFSEAYLAPEIRLKHEGSRVRITAFFAFYDFVRLSGDFCGTDNFVLAVYPKFIPWHLRLLWWITQGQEKKQSFQYQKTGFAELDEKFDMVFTDNMRQIVADNHFHQLIENLQGADMLSVSANMTNSTSELMIFRYIDATKIKEVESMMQLAEFLLDKLYRNGLRS